MSTNLTRLRRAFRDGGDADLEAQKLLDTLDVIHEMQEDMDEEVAKGHHYDEAEVFAHIQECTGLLINTMVHMTSIRADGLLAKLIEEVGYDRVEKALADWKKGYEKRLAEALEEHDDLDDHPF